MDISRYKTYASHGDGRFANEAFKHNRLRYLPYTQLACVQVVRVLNSSSKIRFVSHPGPDVELRIPSVKKAKELFGFEARVDLEEGIIKTAEYLSSLPEFGSRKNSKNRKNNRLETEAVLATKPGSDTHRY